MTYRLVYETGARQAARRLPPDLKALIKRAIESLQNAPYAGKELRFDLAGYRSLRSRRYRVIYRVHEAERVVEIHHFGHRADVYETLRQLVKRGSIGTQGKSGPVAPLSMPTNKAPGI